MEKRITKSTTTLSSRNQRTKEHQIDEMWEQHAIDEVENTKQNRNAINDIVDKFNGYSTNRKLKYENTF